MMKLEKFSNRYSVTNTAKLLFWAPQGRILHSSEINGASTEILNKQGVQRVTFHGLRHTHASVLLYGGMTVLSVARRLGHSSTSTTHSIYLHLVKELEVRDNAKLQRMFDNL
jgi:integrase